MKPKRERWTPIIERFKKLVACTCRQVIGDDHPLSVDAVGGSEHIVCEVHCRPEDVGLILWAPGRPWPAPHGHMRVAAGLGWEKPLPAAVTGVVLGADASAMAGEGVGHA